jgi:nitroimidazol reductase NimA-like FMN-containing flavoprotein (pyridoxamine 5'-phosphate oxidase superfamily)
MSVEEWTRLRRSKQAVPEAEIKAHLLRAPFGFTATALNGQPFLHTSLFWFDEARRCIYFHGANEGRTLDNVRLNPRVCFGVAEMGQLLPADTAMGFGNEYQGVIVFGQVRLAQDVDEKRCALQGLLDKYFPDLRPDRDYRPITDEEMSRTTVFAIEIDGWSGKRHEAST